MLPWQENPEDEPASRLQYTGKLRMSQIKGLREGGLPGAVRGLMIHAFYEMPYPEGIDLLLMNHH